MANEFDSSQASEMLLCTAEDAQGKRERERDRESESESERHGVPAFKLGLVVLRRLYTASS